MTTDWDNKNRQDDEWIAHALRKTQWPEPPCDLKRRIILNADESPITGIPVNMALLFSRMSLQALLLIVFAGFYVIGSFIPLPYSTQYDTTHASIYERVYTQGMRYGNGESL